ncbi:MAG: hypothetical protein NTX53_07005 [candidate division WOR-3 bacterium]|nr:hypothetical protein [candidate division WOR-3 bacterium]
MRLTTVILCAVLVVCACVSPVRVTKPGGDDAVVAFRQGGTARVELLAVSDSNLLFVRDNAVTRAALADISRVRVEGYSVRTNKYIALGCIGLVNTVICVDMAFHSAWHFAAVTAMLCVAGAHLLLRDEPRVDFRSPFDTGAREQLALYCRYPQGLTDEQWQELLRFYHQDAFLSSGDMPRP